MFDAIGSGVASRMTVLKENPTARDIAEYLLDCTGAALKSGDFEQFFCCFNLPLEIHTFDGWQSIKVKEDLQTVFENVRKYHRKMCATDFVRTCLAAEFKDPDTIHMAHESRLLQGTRHLQKPYPVFSIVERVDGRWKVGRSEYAVIDSPDLSKALDG